VATLQILLSRVIPLPATVEVEHPHSVGGALGVPLHDGVRATAMRTKEEIAKDYFRNWLIREAA